MALRSSATLGLLACNELAGNCQREDLSVRLGESLRAIYGLDHWEFDLEQGYCPIAIEMDLPGLMGVRV